MFFIKNAGSLEVVPKILDTGEYKKAFNIAETANMSKEEWEYYDIMSMKIQDEKGAVEAAYEKGEEKGIEKGAIQKNQELIIKALSKRFKYIPEDIISQVRQINEIDQLDKIFDAVFEIDNIDQLTLS